MIAFITWARLVVRHNGKGTKKRKGYLRAGKKMVRSQYYLAVLKRRVKLD